MQWSFWLGDKKRNQLVRLSKNEMLNLCVPFSYKVEASLEKEEEEEEEEKEKEKEKEKEEGTKPMLISKRRGSVNGCG